MHILSLVRNARKAMNNPDRPASQGKTEPQPPPLLGRLANQGLKTPTLEEFEAATFVSRAETRPDVLAQGLKEMGKMGTGQPLPVDLSRDDVHDDHD